MKMELFNTEEQGHWLVSVIVPVYNVKPYLEEALESVINQTYRNLEILLIDDGSTDGSGETCADYKQRDSRIIVLHQNNRGLSAARNAGLDRATGEINVFFDPDDVMELNAIERIVTVMEQTSAKILVFGTKNYYTDEIISAPKDGVYDRNDALRSSVTKQGICGAIWTKAFRAPVLYNIRFREGHNYVDLSVFLQAVDRTGSFVVISETLFRYRKRPGSITTSHTPQNCLDGIDQNRWLCEYGLKNNTDGMLNEVIDRLKLGLVVSMLTSYSALYYDNSPESKAVKALIQEEILRSKPINNLWVKLAVVLFKCSPRFFVVLHDASHVIRKAWF